MRSPSVSATRAWRWTTSSSVSVRAVARSAIGRMVPPAHPRGGSVPDGGFQGGPPAGGSIPDGGPGGEGFDPTDRLIQQLELDEDDPAVTAAVEVCQAGARGCVHRPTDAASTDDDGGHVSRWLVAVVVAMVVVGAGVGSDRRDR